ncbi:hypothetical protein AD998_01610 [bacterium 336/3]|nr:hypothetical protein AD998_01610 [bacterium 336/3]
MEIVSVKSVKDWARDNCPPLSWQRVVFRVLPKLNQKGVFLHFFEKDDYLIQEDVLAIINTGFEEIFKKKYVYVTKEDSSTIKNSFETKIDETSKSVQNNTSDQNFVDTPVKEVKAWVLKNCSPTAWNTVIMSMLPKMREFNMTWRNLEDDTFILDNKVLQEIQNITVKIYNKTLNITK